MSRSVDEIYQKIAQDIVNAIDDEWKSAVMSVELLKGAANFKCRYLKGINNEEQAFDPDPFSLDDFEELHDIMTAEGQHNWNRATFTLYSDGNFDIDFKYDIELSAEIKRLENEPDERFDS